MRFIDCSCTLGRGVVNHVVVNHEGFTLIEKVSEAKDAKELLDQMDYCGIEQALVTHQAMTDVTPQYGNQKIIGECSEGANRLLPVWSILPPVSDEEFIPERLFSQMKKHGVSALYANPHKNRYFLNAITMGELLSEIQNRKILLILTPEFGYEHIYGLLNEYPNMHIIVKNYGPWSPDRYWFPLLRKYQHVHFEIGDYQTDGGLERIVGKFGAEQLLFGTDFPTNNMGGAIAVLTTAEISHSDKEAIAHGNIERLLCGVKL